MRFILITTLFLVTTYSSAAFAADVVNHKPFNTLLKTYVKKGKVDYKGLKGNAEDMGRFNTYVESLANAKITKKHSQKSKLAFYINAYNANVIKAVVERYPLKSVMKVEGFFKKIDHKVAGKTMTLDHLENQIVRKDFKEPRIHFALVCAAKSCPPLKAKAFTEKNLEKQLEKNAKKFISKTTTIEGNVVTASQLFNWFADDFKGDKGSVNKYLANYLPDHSALLLTEGVEIKFSNYDWDLNNK